MIAYAAVSDPVKGTPILRYHFLVLAALVAAPIFQSAAYADDAAGAYLAARQAAINGDISASAQYHPEALGNDPENTILRLRAQSAYVGLGDFDMAAAIAQPHDPKGDNQSLTTLIRHVVFARAGDWRAILDELDAGASVNPLVDGLTKGWALIGTGNMTGGIEQFDTLAADKGLSAFAQWHKALALGSIGDFDGAQGVFVDGAQNGLTYTVRRAIAHAQIMAQIDQTDAARNMIETVFGGSVDEVAAALLRTMAAGEPVAYDFAKTPAAGLAEVYFDIAQAIESDENYKVTLRFARAAQALNPSHDDAVLIAAKALNDLQQYTLATQAYRAIEPTSPRYLVAELGRSDALYSAGKSDAAIEVLEALQRSHSNNPSVYAALGDIMRRTDQPEAARDAYTTALELYEPTNPTRWFIIYARGIAHHKLGNWPAAEENFRAALELYPNNPDILNYLGYSMVEEGVNLDEALTMIETAVAIKPESGAIVDSLGWVLFKLGDYDQAVGHLETAVTLMPSDPVINDHLGDAYWVTGRKYEAHFQWQRALSYDPTEADIERITRKLSIGLDAVLAAEGAEPIEVAR